MICTTPVSPPCILIIIMFFLYYLAININIQFNTNYKYSSLILMEIHTTNPPIKSMLKKATNLGIIRLAFL